MTVSKNIFLSLCHKQRYIGINKTIQLYKNFLDKVLNFAQIMKLGNLTWLMYSLYWKDITKLSDITNLLYQRIHKTC